MHFLTNGSQCVSLVMWSSPRETFRRLIVVPCSLLNGPPFPPALEAHRGCRQGGDGHAKPPGLPPFNRLWGGNDQDGVTASHSAWTASALTRVFEWRRVVHSLNITILINSGLWNCPFLVRHPHSFPLRTAPQMQCPCTFFLSISLVLQRRTLSLSL